MQVNNYQHLKNVKTPDVIYYLIGFEYFAHIFIKCIFEMYFYLRTNLFYFTFSFFGQPSILPKQK